MSSLLKKTIASFTTLACAATMLGFVAMPAQAAISTTCRANISTCTASELSELIAEYTATMNQLQAQINALQGGTTTPTSTITGCTITSFDRNLSQGMTGNDVKCLQIILNTDTATKVATTGAGSPGKETSYFGPLTKAAVIKFQEKYASEVLASWNLTKGTGYVGTTTRAKLNSLLTGGVTPGCTCTSWTNGACGVGTCTATQRQQTRTCTGTCTPTDVTTQCVADTTCTTPAASGLTVALASDTPVATTLADGSAFNNILKVKLTAGSEGAVNVTGLKVTKGGISADTYVEGILVVDQNGIRHGTVITALAADSTASLTFADNPIAVPAGQTVDATIQVNIGTNFGSGTINMSIAAATAVTSNASAVNGTFPIVGNTMGVVDGAASIGGLYVDSVLFHNNSTDDATVVNVNLNTVDQIIGKFKLTESAASASEDVKIEKITIYNNGNTTDADIANIDLVAPDGTILATVASLTSKYATFDLTASPYVIPNGSNKTLTVRCDIVAGSTRTIRFLIENDYDVVVKGVSSGAGILPTVDSGGSDTAFPVGDKASTNYINKVTIASGSLSVSKDTSSPSGNISIGATNQTLAAFKLTASGEDIRLEKMRVNITIPAAAYELIGTLKVQDSSGATLWSLAASNDNLYSTGTPTQYTLSVRKTIAAGSSEIIKVIGDVSTSATSAYTYLVNIRDLYAKRMNTGDYVTYSSGTDVGGNTLTVSTSALTLAKNEAFGSTTEVAGGTKTKIGSFVLQAGSAEAINVSSLKVTLGTFGGGAVTDYSNLIVEKSDGTQLGSTVVSPASAGDTISISGFTVAASASQIVNVFSTITSGITSGETVVVTMGTIGATGASSATTITSPSDTGGQTITWATSGALAVSTDTSTPSPAVSHADETDVTVLKFILSSSYEAINVTKIVIESTKGAANIANVKLFDGTTQVGTTQSLSSGLATFSGLTLSVPKDGAKYMSVKISTTSSGTLVSADTLKLAVKTIESTGGGSGVVIYPSNISTAGTVIAVDGTTYLATITVTSTTGFALGDPVMTFNATDGAVYGIVTSVASATSMVIATNANLTAATIACKVTKIESGGITTAGSAGQLVKAGTTAATVTSTSGFGIGDVVMVYKYKGSAAVSAVFGMVITVDSATAMKIAVPADFAAGYYAARVTKVGNSAYTVGTVIALGTGTNLATITVTSTTGFAIGDAVMTFNATDGAVYGIVTSVASATSMVVATNTALTAATIACKVTKISTDTTTAATAGLLVKAGTTNATVTSSNGLAIGDVVMTYQDDSTATSAESAILGMVISVGTSTTAGISVATAYTGTQYVVRVSEIWSSNGVGKPNVLHDVEPVITKNAASPTNGSPATLETIAKFDIKADGPRNLTIESITIYRGGSTTTAVVAASAPKIYIGSDLLGTGANWSAEAAGAYSLVDLTTPYTISAGQTVTFDVKVNTSSIVTVNATFQVYIDGTAGVATAADASVDWYYTAASPSPGTEPTETSPTSYCDNYPIYGNTLRY